jgi:hypothetical protein
MLSLKDGVKVTGIKPELLLAINVVDSVFHRLGITECTITSIVDGVHKRTSLHSMGLAFDLRTRHLKPEVASNVRDYIAAALGKDYDVILEPDHIHCEYDPKAIERSPSG